MCPHAPVPTQSTEGVKDSKSVAPKMGAASGKADASQAEAAAVNPLGEGSFQDWTGRLVNMDTADAPDPKMLNQICDDDPFAGIDFQKVPYRVLEALRKKVEKSSMAACRPHHEEVVACLTVNNSRSGNCKPLLREYYKCMAGWRDDNDSEYYKLVKDAVEGKLLDKWRRRQHLLEEEWKKRFPDSPMPRVHIPGSGKDDTYYLHELDKDLVTRDLAMQRLAELDAEQQNMSVEDYKNIKRGATDSRAWQPVF